MIRLFNSLMYHTYVAIKDLGISKVGQKTFSGRVACYLRFSFENKVTR